MLRAALTTHQHPGHSRRWKNERSRRKKQLLCITAQMHKPSWSTGVGARESSLSTYTATARDGSIRERVDYSRVDSRPESKLLLRSVRKLLVREVGTDISKHSWADFAGITEHALRVVRESKGASVVQSRAYRVFQGILPSVLLGWVPSAWRNYVAGRLPDWVTSASFAGVFQSLFPWLMGPMQVHARTRVPLPFTHGHLAVHVPNSVEAERCRFLEESQCASVCINACKIPSQQWLKDDFNIDVHVQPNFEDFSCVWQFGTPAPPLEEDDAAHVPCFPVCPTTSKQAASQTMVTLEHIADRASSEAIEDASMLRRSVASELGNCKHVEPAQR